MGYTITSSTFSKDTVLELVSYSYDLRVAGHDCLWENRELQSYEGAELNDGSSAVASTLANATLPAHMFGCDRTIFQLARAFQLLCKLLPDRGQLLAVPTPRRMKLDLGFGPKPLNILLDEPLN